MLLDALDALQPPNTIFRKLLYSWKKLRFMQTEVINSTNAHDALSRKARSATIHESSTVRTKEVGHGASIVDSFRLSEGFQLAANVGKIFVVDGEVACKH